MRETLFIGRADEAVVFNPIHATCHGLIAGASGTGKTVTVQVLAEELSAQGVPVFLADVNGDLSGLGVAGEASEDLAERARTITLDAYETRAFPIVFWDLFGKRGHPVRLTVSEIGPLLLARLMDLNNAQEAVLDAAFAVADDQGWAVLDLQDLRGMLTHLGDHAKRWRGTYGTISANSVAAIQRRILVMESEGADAFFGEPAFDIHDLLRHDGNGLGVINVLAAEALIDKPRTYGAFLLWLLSEVFEQLPEAGEVDTPKLVLFFDAAHVVFDEMPPVLLDKVQTVVRLIRSKGVGVFFIADCPTDVPEAIRSQLSNRFQHALPLLTAKDRRALHAAAERLPDNPAFDTAKVMPELAVGEALVSTLGADGVPGMAQRTRIRPPASNLGPADDATRSRIVSTSPVAGRYDDATSREAAYETLIERVETAAQLAANAAPEQKTLRTTRNRRPARPGLGDARAAALHAPCRRIDYELVRGLLGSLFRGR